MKRINGFMRSHYMPPSGECPRNIAPVAAIVVVVGMRKKHNTQLAFYPAIIVLFY
jgi:hypothetical protein